MDQETAPGSYLGSALGSAHERNRTWLACSKRSDSEERCEVKIAMKSRGGLGREVREPSLTSPTPSLLFFSRSFFLRTAPHYLNAWNRLGHDSMSIQSSSVSVSRGRGLRYEPAISPYSSDVSIFQDGGQTEDTELWFRSKTCSFTWNFFGRFWRKFKFWTNSRASIPNSTNFLDNTTHCNHVLE